MSHSSFTSPPVVEPRGFFHKSSGLHLGSRQSLDMIWMKWDSHALMAPFFGTDWWNHTHEVCSKFAVFMLSVSKPLALYDLTCRTCSKMRLEQSANRHVFSWKQWLSHCGEKHPMSWGRKIRVLEPILLHREVISQRLRSQDLLGLHRQKNTQPLGRHDPSGITFSKYAGPWSTDQAGEEQALTHTKHQKNASKWTKYPKKVVGKWSRLPSLGDDFWFVLLQTKIAHLGSASNICALRLENLEKHISPMAIEWQTKLEGWKAKTTPTHTVFFYLQHDAVKHGWTMSLD